MKTNIGIIAIFSLIMLIVIPANAAVNNVEINKEVITASDSFIISGTISDAERVTLLASMKGPSQEKLTRTGMSDHDGTYTFTPIKAADLFKSEGEYEINVFTEYERPENGTKIKIQYKNKIASVLPDFKLILNSIGNKQVKETETLTFTASVTDSNITSEKYSVEKHPDGVSINKDTGVFSWTPTESQSGGYIFDIVVNAGILEDREIITVTVTDKPTPKPIPKPITKPIPKSEPEPEPITEPKELGIASFVDKTKEPQSYVDRYNNEESYKKWFDDNHSKYDSIYQAVGLEKPLEIPASFVDKTKDPQSYVDRYNNEESYKKWFDDNHSKYNSIYHAVGLEEPSEVASFVDSERNPQYYVDRYNNEESYKDWFDTTYPNRTIYQLVGLEEPVVKVPEFGECGIGTELIGDECIIIDNSQGGGCLIATAAYGTELAPQVQLLREVRDNTVMSTQAGMTFMSGFNQMYYSFSPTIADWQRENPVFQQAVRAFITPMVSTLSVMTLADNDSEIEVLGLGISVIALNLGIYVAIPAIIVFKAKKYIKI